MEALLARFQGCALAIMGLPIKEGSRSMRTRALRLVLALIVLALLAGCPMPPNSSGGIWDQSRWNEATWQ